MWGPAIVGFGDYHYQYDTAAKRIGSKPASRRAKQALTLYLMGGKSKELLNQTRCPFERRGCLYLKSLDGHHKPDASETHHRFGEASSKDRKGKSKRPGDLDDFPWPLC
jgi:hypothetical protein